MDKINLKSVDIAFVLDKNRESDIVSTFIPLLMSEIPMRKKIWNQPQQINSNFVVNENFNVHFDRELELCNYIDVNYHRVSNVSAPDFAVGEEIKIWIQDGDLKRILYKNELNVDDNRTHDKYEVKIKDKRNRNDIDKHYQFIMDSKDQIIRLKMEQGRGESHEMLFEMNGNGELIIKSIRTDITGEVFVDGISLQVTVKQHYDWIMELFHRMKSLATKEEVDQLWQKVETLIKEIQGNMLTLGEGSDQAYWGDRGKVAYDHALSPHAPVDAQKNSDILKEEIEDKLTGVIYSHTHDYTEFYEMFEEVHNILANKSDIDHVHYYYEILDRLELGTGMDDAYYGNLGQVAYEHSQSPHAPVDAQKNSDILKEEIEEKLVGTIESHSHYAKDIIGLPEPNTLELGLEAHNAYYGNLGHIAYEHSQSPHAPEDAQKNSDITKREIEDKLTGIIDTHQHHAEDIIGLPEPNDLILGIENHNAFYGDLGNVAYEHSQTQHAPVDAQKNSDITKDEIEAKLVGIVDTHQHNAESIVGMLQLGTANHNAFYGDLGQFAYDHSRDPHAPVDAQKNSDILKEEIEQKLTGIIDTHQHDASSIIGMLQLGVERHNAFYGDMGQIAYDHAQSPHAPVDAQKNSDILKEEIENKLTGVVNSHQHTADSIIGLLQLGTERHNAFFGDLGQAAYDHSRDPHAPIDAQKNSDILKEEIEDKLTGIIDSHQHDASDIIGLLQLGTERHNAFFGDLGQAAYEHSREPHAPVDAQKNSDILKEEIEDKLTGVIETHQHNASNIIGLLQLGTERHNAYYGDLGQQAYEHSREQHAPIDAQKNSDILKEEIEAKLTGVIDSHQHDASTIVGMLQLGTDRDKAFYGDLGQIAYDHSREPHAPVDAQPNRDILKEEIEDKLTGVITSHQHHARDIIGLDDVEVLKLGTEHHNAFYGDLGQVAYEHSREAHAPYDAQKNSDILKEEIEAKLTGVIDTHQHRLKDIVDIDQLELLKLGTEANNAFYGDQGFIAFQHSQMPHAPEDAQKNSDILKEEIEEKLTGQIDTHYHSVEQIVGLDLSNQLQLGTRNTNAFYGDLGQIAYEHSQLPHAPANAQKNSDILKEEIEERLVGIIDSHGHHAKDIIGLDGLVGLELGTENHQAFYGDLGQIAYDHSRELHAPPDAQANRDILKEEIEEKLTGIIESHSHNPSEIVGLTEIFDKVDYAYDHSISEHAPEDAQKNSDILQEEIEAKLQGIIESHQHHVKDIVGLEAYGLELGFENHQAFHGDLGLIAFDHSQEEHAPVDAQKNSDILLEEIEEKLIGIIESHQHYAKDIVDIDNYGVQLGFNEDEAFYGHYGLIAYEHALEDHAPVDAQKNSDILKEEIEDKLTGVIDTHEHGINSIVGLTDVLVRLFNGQDGLNKDIHSYSNINELNQSTFVDAEQIIVEEHGGYYIQSGTFLTYFNLPRIALYKIPYITIRSGMKMNIKLTTYANHILANRLIGEYIFRFIVEVTYHDGISEILNNPNIPNVKLSEHPKDLDFVTEIIHNMDSNKQVMNILFYLEINGDDISLDDVFYVSKVNVIPLPTPKNKTFNGLETHNVSLDILDFNLLSDIPNGKTIIHINDDNRHLIDFSDLPDLVSIYSKTITDMGVFLFNIQALIETDRYDNGDEVIVQNLIILPQVQMGELRYSRHYIRTSGWTDWSISDWHVEASSSGGGTGTSDLELGILNDQAYYGNLGHIAYTHSQDDHAPVDAQKNSDILKEEIEDKLTGIIDTHSHMIDIVDFNPGVSSVATRIQLGFGVDLNEIKDLGYYRSNGLHPNSPLAIIFPSVNPSFNLDIERTTANGIQQTVTYTNAFPGEAADGHVVRQFIRTWNVAFDTWGSWSRMDNEAIPLPPNTDLNSVLLNGMFVTQSINDPLNMINSPWSGHFILENRLYISSRTSVVGFQYLYPSNRGFPLSQHRNGNIYFFRRVGYNEPFGPWIEANRTPDSGGGTISINTATFQQIETILDGLVW